MARRADDLSDDPMIALVNPETDASPSTLDAWIAELDAEGDWIDVPVTAAELIAEDRAASRS